MTDLVALFKTGVEAVRGNASVAAALADKEISAPDQVISVGKAAASMAQAAAERFGPVPMLVVTKYDHCEGVPAHAEVIEAAHPVPDENSLVAGQRLRRTVEGMAPGSHLLMLVSGGASALAEDPVDGLDLDGLKARSSQMLGSGADIHAMNRIRKTLSRIKGGKLLSRFPGSRVTTLAISDVEGDALSVIGSGIGDAPDDRRFTFEPHIVASNQIARHAVLRAATDAGLAAQDHGEMLYADINDLAPRLAKFLGSAAPGLHVFGGEPTVILPPYPGHGGRNQALALLLAREIAGVSGLCILVAGTDGTDGPTDAAGALVTGETWETTAQPALDKADAGTWLAAHDALVWTGPTGTNVMDLLIAEKLG